MQRWFPEKNERFFYDGRIVVCLELYSDNDHRKYSVLHVIEEDTGIRGDLVVDWTLAHPMDPVKIVRWRKWKQEKNG